VRVVVVAIRDVRIADWKGAVRDWVLVPNPGNITAEQATQQEVNGIR